MRMAIQNVFNIIKIGSEKQMLIYIMLLSLKTSKYLKLRSLNKIWMMIIKIMMEFHIAQIIVILRIKSTILFIKPFIAKDRNMMTIFLMMMVKN